MIYTTTLSTKGQVVIPKSVREQLKLVPGQRLVIELKNKNKKQISIQPVTPIEELAGSLGPVKYIPLKKARNIAGRALAKKYGLKV